MGERAPLAYRPRGTIPQGMADSGTGAPEEENVGGPDAVAGFVSQAVPPEVAEIGAERSPGLFQAGQLCELGAGDRIRVTVQENVEHLPGPGAERAPPGFPQFFSSDRQV